MNRENKRKTFEKDYYKSHPCHDSFTCRVCGRLCTPENAGSDHRNHCPNCLSSLHVDVTPGDRASDCGGIMEPVAVWVRRGGEWALIHRCRRCGALCSNRVAADDNPMKLMSIALKPLTQPPFPLERIEEMTALMGGVGLVNLFPPELLLLLLLLLEYVLLEEELPKTRPNSCFTRENAPWIAKTAPPIYAAIASMSNSDFHR